MIALDTALYSRLSTDATLTSLATGGVYHLLAPQGGTPPYLIYAQYGNAAQPWTFGNNSPYTLYEYQFKAVAAGMDAQVNENILAQVKTLLNDYALVVSGFTTMVVRRNRIGAPMAPGGDVIGGLPSYQQNDYYMIGLS